MAAISFPSVPAIRARLALLADAFHAGDYSNITFDNVAPVTISELPEGCEVFATVPDTDDRTDAAEGGEI